MKKISIVLAALLMCFSVCSFGQTTKAGLSFQFGGILPMGEFHAQPTGLPIVGVIPGINSFEHNGGAMFGASFGVKYTYSFQNTKMENSGLGIFVSADGMWNALNKDLRDKYDSWNVTKPMYVNVPIMAGISYTTTFSDVFGLWAEAGLGADLFFKTPEGTENTLTKYKMSPEFAFEAGAGILLVRTVSLGAHYYWLGSHNVKVQEGSLFENSQPSYPMNIGVWAFKVGFHF
ncbi:MAG: hypothetical protein J6T59_00775 [Bacteroidales bacterium]|nr:hypothetical protein [Bacteroidales bacterium]